MLEICAKVTPNYIGIKIVHAATFEKTVKNY